jgi:hypothetical protein
MTGFKYCLFVLFLTGPAVVHAAEYELGRLTLPPCSKVEWRSEGGIPGIKFNVPEVKVAPQNVLLSAHIEGAGVEAPENAPAVRECATGAFSSIGAGVAASDTAGATGLFRELLTKCLVERAPNVKIGTAFIKTATTCAW